LFYAQALFAYDSKQKPTAPRILTPHEDEFKALIDGKEVDMNAPETVAHEFAQKSSTVLVLKGQNTFIATPDGSIFKNEAGSRALGKENFFNCIKYCIFTLFKITITATFSFSITCFMTTSIILFRYCR